MFFDLDGIFAGQDLSSWAGRLGCECEDLHQAPRLRLATRLAKGASPLGFVLLTFWFMQARHARVKAGFMLNLITVPLRFISLQTTLLAAASLLAAGGIAAKASAAAGKGEGLLGPHQHLHLLSSIPTELPTQCVRSVCIHAEHVAVLINARNDFRLLKNFPCGCLL